MIRNVTNHNLLGISTIAILLTKNRMKSLEAIRAGTEEEMMIEIGVIAVTSLTRIQDLSNDLIEVLVFEAKVRCEIMIKEMTEISANMTEATFVITLVMDESHECDSLDRLNP